MCQNLGEEFARGVPELWGFKVKEFQVPPNFQRPLVAKLYIELQNVLEV